MIQNDLLNMIINELLNVILNELLNVILNKLLNIILSDSFFQLEGSCPLIGNPVKEIVVDIVLYAPQLNSVAPQLAICCAQFTLNLLRIQFVLKY